MGELTHRRPERNPDIKRVTCCERVRLSVRRGSSVRGFRETHTQDLRNKPEYIQGKGEEFILLCVERAAACVFRPQ
ncbi:unnamed protein product [Gadus morhua 'NCC']